MFSISDMVRTLFSFIPADCESSSDDYEGGNRRILDISTVTVNIFINARIGVAVWCYIIMHEDLYTICESTYVFRYVSNPRSLHTYLVDMNRQFTIAVCLEQDSYMRLTYDPQYWPHE